MCKKLSDLNPQELDGLKKNLDNSTLKNINDAGELEAVISELKLNKRKDFLSNNKEVGQFSPINDSDPEKMMKSVKNLEIDKKNKLIQKITNNDKLSKNSKFKFLKGKTSLDDLDSKELSKFNDLINNTKKSKELVDLPEFQTLKKMDEMFYAGDDAITNFNKQTKNLMIILT